MLLMIDNYDSFTYNIVQMLETRKQELLVELNDKLTLADIEALQPKGIIISPGPCGPKEAGISLAVVKAFAGKCPILGVCLGHQVIAEAFGAEVVKAPSPVHGKTYEINHDGKGLFRGLQTPFQATRYHSLVVDPDSVPDQLEVSARSEDGLIMGLRHREYLIEGVQFHPESYLTTQGGTLIDNFLALKVEIDEMR